MFKNFTDFNDGSLLEKLYEVPDDVDLYVGGMLENHAPDELLGETFSCLIVQQFYNSRYGDRFWYEREGNTGFTTDQLQEIRKVSLAGIICQNTDSIYNVTKEAMSVDTNIINCDDVPTMDLSKWVS